MTSPSSDIQRSHAELLALVQSEETNLASLDVQVEMSKQRRSAYLNAVRALETAYPQLSESVVQGSQARERDTAHPGRALVIARTGKDAVRAFLAAHPDQWFTTGEMLDAIVQRGWLPGNREDNENRVRVATIRLHAEDVLERRKGSGRGFQFKIKDPAEAGSSIA